MTLPSRRQILLASAALLLASPARAETGAVTATGAAPAIHVVKDANCGCCSAWIALLEAEGFAVTTEIGSGTLLMRYKAVNGISPDLASCHTGKVEGYVLEGHVPPTDIRRLLAERPEAVGLAVPGMPYGSPGMGPENEREAYDVLLVLQGGGTEVFSRYPAA